MSTLGSAITLPAISVSTTLLPLFSGTVQSGVGMGMGYVRFGDVVVAVVPPGYPRMPNGVETDVRIDAGQPAHIGDGHLDTMTHSVTIGRLWNPVPSPAVTIEIGDPFIPDVAALLGRGPGLTPAGDDLLIGFLAGQSLFRAECEPLIYVPVNLTTALSRTLLVEAMGGALPEPAHALVEEGDLTPLRSFGHSSGLWLAVGLCLAACARPHLPVRSPEGLTVQEAEAILQRCRITSRSAHT
jgi:hypothetical protein